MGYSVYCYGNDDINCMSPKMPASYFFRYLFTDTAKSNSTHSLGNGLLKIFRRKDVAVYDLRSEKELYGNTRAPLPIKYIISEYKCLLHVSNRLFN